MKAWSEVSFLKGDYNRVMEADVCFEKEVLTLSLANFMISQS